MHHCGLHHSLTLVNILIFLSKLLNVAINSHIPMPVLEILASLPIGPPVKVTPGHLLIFTWYNISESQAFLMEFWRYYPENTPSYVGVRTRKYKYNEFERGRKPWLIDLETDPQELNNIYDAGQGNKILPELRALLKHFTRVGMRMAL